MAEYRQIQCSYWRDPFVLGLTPEERYFYLYLLSNSETSQCGAYELPLILVSFETGYNTETVNKLISKFEEYKKVIYDRDTQEIFVINWLKHNWIDSPKVIARIKSEICGIKSEKFREALTLTLSEKGHTDSELYRTKNRAEIPKTIALFVFDRDGNRCCRCDAVDDLTIDHIFPRSMGGTNYPKNLRVMCRSCNSKRPITGSGLLDDLKIDGLSLDQLNKLCPDMASKISDTVSEKSDTVPEEGEGEGEGEGEKKNKKKKTALVDLPTWLNKQAWEEWVQHRQEIKKPLTPLAAKKSIDVLEAHQSQQREIINTSISRGWTGLFPPKEARDSGGKQPRAFPT